MAQSDSSGFLIFMAIMAHACMTSLPKGPIKVELTGDVVECLCAEQRDAEARVQPEVDNPPPPSQR